MKLFSLFVSLCFVFGCGDKDSDSAGICVENWKEAQSIISRFSNPRSLVASDITEEISSQSSQLSEALTSINTNNCHEEINLQSTEECKKAITNYVKVLEEISQISPDTFITATSNFKSSCMKTSSP